jgi:molybdopterin adenylyltransferase
MQIVVGIITISDRASAGDYKDLGGPALKDVAQKSGWQVLCEAVIRDVTPEAIRAIMRVELPGFGEVMRAESMKITPNSILSRNLAAVVDLSLVIALPGKPSGAVECLGFVAGAIPHGVALAQRAPTSC